MQPSSEPQTGRILVVDDNEMNRDMLSRRLQRRGYDVALAEHGRQALDMVEAGGFDLVLLDIMMPEMNGYEVLERLKADDDWCHIPVIMISAVDEMDSIVRCIKLGAADYLSKPFNATLLGARVEACLAHKRLHDREQLYAASMARELEIGRNIQRGFLPWTLPAVPGWELDARFLPARQVAGDFYDAFRFRDSDRIGLVLADVCDKGVGAALFMALFRTLIRVFAQEACENPSPPGVLHETVTGVNDYIARTHSRANMFATAFVGILDPNTGALHYINAGHEPPAVVSGSGIRERLEPTGPAMGLLPDLAFGVSEVTLDPDDLLVIFTDGVTDALSPEGTPFSEDRLLALLTETPGSAGAVLDRIEAAVASHVSGQPSFDDITLLAVHRAPTG